MEDVRFQADLQGECDACYRGSMPVMIGSEADWDSGECQYYQYCYECWRNLTTVSSAVDEESL